MNEGDSELLTAAARVVGVFEELGVDYFVGGSLASSIFGEPRQTIDADLIARLLARHAGPLVQKLAGEFYIELEAVLAAVRTQGSFNLIHLENMTKIDVFIRWRSTFAQSQFGRRQKKSIGSSPPLELFFASAEDTILAKLQWYREGGGVSDRQWRDILGILKIQAERLDLGYLTQWATELSVTDLFHRALDESGSKSG